MASTYTTYGGIQTLTTTNLQSLANSPTTYWRSAEISNATDRWDDALVEVTLAFSVGAPANSQAAFVYVDGRNDPASLGSEGTVSGQPDVTTGPVPFRLIGRVPFRVSGATVRISVASVASAFGGTMPTVWRVIVVNHSGVALAASGSAITWRGVRTEVV